MSDGAWQRFLDQKTVPQRLLIAVAALVAACVTIAAGIGAAGGLLGDGDSDGGATNERVAQGSEAADRLVRRLIEADGKRVELQQIVEAPEGIAPFSGGDIRLDYNCKDGGGPCNLARLQPSDRDSRRPDVVDGTAAYYNGTYAIDVARGSLYGTDVDIVMDNADL